MNHIHLDTSYRLVMFTVCSKLQRCDAAGLLCLRCIVNYICQNVMYLYVFFLGHVMRNSSSCPLEKRNPNRNTDISLQQNWLFWRERWRSGRASDSESRGPGFDTQWRHRVVSEQGTLTTHSTG